MGDLSKAKAFYEETIGISEREDIRILYKNDILQSKSNALGNIGLIYSNQRRSRPGAQVSLGRSQDPQ